MPILNEDVSQALPHLNAFLGGVSYYREPASVTFKANGKLIAVHGDKIAVNALKDEAEAEKILQWMKSEINAVWENHDSIEPSFDSADSPDITQILGLLPKTNCKACGEATCMVFAVRVMEGVKDQEDCPQIDLVKKRGIERLFVKVCV